MAYFFPAEIVTMILSNLGQTDLLSCRLVNQTWNRECLLVFCKSSFRMRLNICKAGGNADKYIEFATTQNPQLVLPIHLSLDSFQRPHTKSLDIVTSLQKLSGPDSIQSLTMDIRCVFAGDDNNVMLLLSKISHALKTLELKYYYVACAPQMLLDFMKDLSFPNVTSLKYMIGTKRRLMEIQSQFILKCPKLTELCLESESPELNFLTTLQKLALKTLTDPRRFRNNILECSRLDTLKIYEYKSEDRQIIHQILKSLEKTLKSLTIGVDAMFQLPRLPRLESLRLHSMTEQSAVVGLNSNDLNLNSETFPSLKLFGLPFIFSLCNGSPLYSVKTLTLRVSACHRNPYVNCGVSMEDNFKNFAMLFPNATTVSLKQGIPEIFQCKTVLKELISSELAGQMEQIHIDGGLRDILGETMEHNRIPPQIMMTFSGQRNYEAEALIQEAFGLWTGDFGIEGIKYQDGEAGTVRRVVFTEAHQSGHKMRNVKKVRLVFRRLGKEEFPNLKLNLMSIAKNLPGLVEIELIGIKRELYLKRFDDLAIEYPHLLLKINTLSSKQ